LIVIRFFGKSRREFVIALRTRSFASSIALLPKPTICNDGNDLVASLYTSTIKPSKPTGATVIILETISLI
jgi:hypothetical protein